MGEVRAETHSDKHKAADVSEVAPDGDESLQVRDVGAWRSEWRGYNGVRETVESRMWSRPTREPAARTTLLLTRMQL